MTNDGQTAGESKRALELPRCVCGHGPRSHGDAGAGTCFADHCHCRKYAADTWFCTAEGCTFTAPTYEAVYEHAIECARRPRAPWFVNAHGEGRS